LLGLPLFYAYATVDSMERSPLVISAQTIRRFVSQGNCRNLGCSPCHQLHEPWPLGSVPLGKADDRHGPTTSIWRK
jgi:hypothetical protein